MSARRSDLVTNSLENAMDATQHAELVELLARIDRSLGRGTTPTPWARFIINAMRYGAEHPADIGHRYRTKHPADIGHRYRTKHPADIGHPDQLLVAARAVAWQLCAWLSEEA